MPERLRSFTTRHYINPPPLPSPLPMSSGVVGPMLKHTTYFILQRGPFDDRSIFFCNLMGVL